jgi:hypothetical protein
MDRRHYISCKINSAESEFQSQEWRQFIKVLKAKNGLVKVKSRLGGADRSALRRKEFIFASMREQVWCQLMKINIFIVIPDT